MMSVLFAMILFLMGVATVGGTTILVVLTLLQSYWDERAKQGTIILTSMGMGMIAVASTLMLNATP